MSDLNDLLCMCPTCTDPAAAVAADLAELDALGCCECCGVGGCRCEIIDHDGYDPETGPYSETVCTTHRVRV